MKRLAGSILRSRTNYFNNGLKSVPVSSNFAVSVVLPEKRQWGDNLAAIVLGASLLCVSSRLGHAEESKPLEVKDRQESEAGFRLVTKENKGNYENRLRKYSAPFKVFQYFASVQKGNEMFMTFEDLVRSLTPYVPHLRNQEVGTTNSRYNFKKAKPIPDSVADEYIKLLRKVMKFGSPTNKDDEAQVLSKSERLQSFLDLLKALQTLRVEHGITTQRHHDFLSTAGFTVAEYDLHIVKVRGKGHSEVFQMLDSNGDGLISFDEYVLVTTLLSIPLKHFKVAFRMIDESQDGYIDRDEFNHVLGVVFNKHSKGGRTVTLGQSGQSASGETHGIWRSFFGKDGTKKLSYDQFEKFRHDLQYAVESVEFDTYDEDRNGSLTFREFGIFLIARCRTTDQETFMKQLDESLPSEKTQSAMISFQEFRDFNRLLDSLEEFKIAMDFLGAHDKSEGLSRESFKACAAAAVSLPGWQLSDQVVEVFFHMFDVNRDKKISQSEMISVLDSRSSVDCRQSGIAAAIVRSIRCVAEAAAILWEQTK